MMIVMSKPLPFPAVSNLEEATSLIRALFERISRLEGELEYYKDYHDRHSGNSSQPPSRDRSSRRALEKKLRKKSSRKRGGQGGHQGHRQEAYSPEEVSEYIACTVPEECECGGAVVVNEEGVRHQVADIIIKPYVKEYVREKGCCGCCHRSYLGALPVGVPSGQYGVGVLSLSGLLSSAYRMSTRQIEEFFRDVCGLKISLGTVSNHQGLLSRALAGEYEQIATVSKQESVRYVDETVYYQNDRKGYAWLAAGANSVLLKLDPSRGKKVAKALLQQYHSRVIVTDRYPGYAFIPQARRQVCWAHLLRDFRKFSERAGDAGMIGTSLLTGDCH